MIWHLGRNRRNHRYGLLSYQPQTVELNPALFYGQGHLKTVEGNTLRLIMGSLSKETLAGLEMSFINHMRCPM